MHHPTGAGVRTKAAKAAAEKQQHQEHIVSPNDVIAHTSKGRQCPATVTIDTCVAGAHWTGPAVVATVSADSSNSSSSSSSSSGGGTGSDNSSSDSSSSDRITMRSKIRQ